MWPLALVMGVNVADCRKVAKLIGLKTFLEFVAYLDLAKLIRNNARLEGHVENNGTWYWSGDHVFLTIPNGDDIKLEDGIISVWCSVIAYSGQNRFDKYVVKVVSTWLQQ